MSNRAGKPKGFGYIEYEQEVGKQSIFDFSSQSEIQFLICTAVQINAHAVFAVIY